MPGAIVNTHVLPPSGEVGGVARAADALVAADPSFRPLPNVLSSSSLTAPAPSVTATERAASR